MGSFYKGVQKVAHVIKDILYQTVTGATYSNERIINKRSINSKSKSPLAVANFSSRYFKNNRTKRPLIKVTMLENDSKD